MFGKNCYDWATMDKNRILEIVGKTESPLKKQLLVVALVTRLLEEAGKSALPANDTLKELRDMKGRVRT